jgi:hypothetical protein
LAAGLVALLAFGGFNLLRAVADGLSSSASPPLPPVSAARDLPALPRTGGDGALPVEVSGQVRATAASGGGSGAGAAAASFAAAMPYAKPMRITVPRVGIDAALIRVGLTRSGAIGVPPLNDALKAAWFGRGPAPGQVGPAVIDAHVDSLALPGRRAAFYSLGAVRPGDRVEVARADGRVAEFTVDSVELEQKRDFPTQKVYGSVPYAALRLITCGGAFRRGTGYLGNVIVYAHLTGQHRG